MLAYDNVDAIVYESVKVKNSPAIAIKPKVVDSCLVHKEVSSIRINENLGYGMYYAEPINECIIDNNNLVWKII